MIKISTCLFLMCLSTMCLSMELVPLDQYIKKNDVKDSVVSIYVHNRCTSLFMALTVQAKNQNDAESIKFTNTARRAYSEMAVATGEIFSKSTKNPEIAIKQNGETIKRLLSAYLDYTNTVMDSGRNLEEDAFFDTEIKICGKLLNSIRQNRQSN